MDSHATEMLLTAIGALAGVVAYLYKQTLTHFTQIQERADECDADRRRLWKELADVRRELGDETSD